MTDVDVCIVEDHRLLGQLVAIELGRIGYSALVLESDDFAIEPIMATQAKLVLLDVELGADVNSLELCRALVEQGRSVVLFTGVTDDVELATYLEAGAMGILGKTEELSRLAAQVRLALHDGAVEPGPNRRIEMLDALRRHRSAQHKAFEPFHRLSSSEAEVLALLIEGHPATTIADQRSVSLTTVRAQIRAIHTKLGVSSQLGAVSLATRVGWRPDG